ncbi:MAG TPA: hypothetical protein VLG76_02980 [Rhabdochlamydiaceae bacterium]|nr:hypothetical protein [Rhabdochlamydiaceae bacterium]
MSTLDLVRSSTRFNSIPETSGTQKVGETLNLVALKLKAPLDHCVRHAVRCFTAIHPGELGNAESRYVEMAKRVGIFILCVGSSLIALPLWAIAVGVDISGDKLTKKAYTELQGTPQGRPPLALGNIGRFFSLNANMLPKIPYLFGGTRPADERISGLAGLINYRDVDFVVLQEVSFKSARALWSAGLCYHFEKAYTRIGPSPLTDFDTCLFIATKRPIIGEPVFIPLPSADQFKRGIFYLETERCYVMTTHLQSNDNKEMRRVQLDKVLETIRKLEERGKPVVLLMDGNINRIDDEYRRRIEPYFYDPYRGPYSQENATCTNELDHYMMGGEKPSKPFEWIDYVCTSKDSNALVKESRLVHAFDLSKPAQAISDHNGFRTVIEF